jgi:predicted enzyme related to lactoylglutathione lyase
VISGVDMVILPVEDQERAKEFWTMRIGFEVTTDAPYADGRWLELTPPDQSVILVLSKRAADEPRAEVSEMLPHSPAFFSCENIQQTYHELSGRGVKFPVPPEEMPFGWWSVFEDDEGTRYALRQE